MKKRLHDTKHEKRDLIEELTEVKRCMHEQAVEKQGFEEKLQRLLAEVRNDDRY